MKNFILKNKFTIISIISVILLLSYCKKQSDVKKLNNSLFYTRKKEDSLQNIIKSKDSLLTLKNLELNSLAEKDGVKTNGCEQQIQLLENSLNECKKDKEKIFKELQKN